MCQLYDEGLWDEALSAPNSWYHVCIPADVCFLLGFFTSLFGSSIKVLSPFQWMSVFSKTLRPLLSSVYSQRAPRFHCVIVIIPIWAIGVLSIGELSVAIT